MTLTRRFAQKKNGVRDPPQKKLFQKIIFLKFNFVNPNRNSLVDSRRSACANGKWAPPLANAIFLQIAALCINTKLVSLFCMMIQNKIILDLSNWLFCAIWVLFPSFYNHLTFLSFLSLPSYLTLLEVQRYINYR